MIPAFSDDGWEHFTGWVQNQRILKKINYLVDDILRNGPLHGKGKPEQLKYYDVPTYSRRIDEENRLVYEYDENAGLLMILSCKGHYKDKILKSS
ncbi:MAG: Txe/YoeB family addiction module toxin [Deltaproteobacteria bacterium]|jgi:toxin YoeB|nr:Txe/YoeB family addiction module toxin [Deltaproteobacteria bacterium]